MPERDFALELCKSY